MLERFRARFRHLAIPGQAAALVLSFVQALLWVPMWAGILSLVDELWFAQFGRGIGIVHWVALWTTAGARVTIWVLRELLDLDLSDGSAR